MKKFVSIFVLLAVLAGSVFAAPAASLKESQSAPTLTEDDLFADVQADALTDTEAAQVDGGLVVTTIVAIIVIAYVSFTATCSGAVRY